MDICFSQAYCERTNHDMVDTRHKISDTVDDYPSSWQKRSYQSNNDLKKLLLVKEIQTPITRWHQAVAAWGLARLSHVARVLPESRGMGVNIGIDMAPFIYLNFALPWFHIFWYATA